MRILRIRFKNLNSLVGEWDIDLAHPAFRADGLFAITGPTGAGKTTILDAICLALYASTPRLSKVSKGANEIMSRRTGECFAEVTFETPAGRYRCHWSQHRARRRPDGELQNPRHEIAEADSGRIIESNLRAVADQVETLTGMDFERFTRSMLLAQGAFDTFLRASPDERAPILEQITGTEIYSRISIAAHERAREERQRLEALTAELAGLVLLSDEEERQLRARLSECEHTDADLTQRLDQTRRAIAWLQGLQDLEAALARVETDWTDLGARQDAFAPERARLERAQRAQGLAGAEAALSAARAELARERQAHETALTALPDQRRALVESETALTQAEAALAACLDEQRALTPILHQARALDLRLAERAGPIQAESDALATGASARADLERQQHQDGEQLDMHRRARAELLERLDETRADAALVEGFASLEVRLGTLAGLAAERTARRDDCARADERITATRHAWDTRRGHRERLKHERDALRDQLDGQRRALDAGLAGCALADWRQRQNASQTRLTQLDRLDDTLKALMAARADLETVQAREAELDRAAPPLAERIRLESERAGALAREIALLETQFDLARRIQDFEEARHQLADGTPCPLCGATEHPYAQGRPPRPDETQAALARAREARQRTDDDLNGLRLQQSELERERTGLASRRDAATATLADQRGRIETIGATLVLPPETTPEQLIAALPEWRRLAHAEYEQATAVLKRAEILGQSIETLRDRLTTADAALADAELATRDAEHQRQDAEQARARLDRDIEELDARWGTLHASLLQAVASHGIETLPDSGLDAILETLKRRRAQWLTRQDDRAEHERQTALLENRIKQRAEHLAQLDRELEQRRGRLDILRRERDALADERRRLLPDRQPDSEEVRLAAAIDQARSARDTAQHARLGAVQAVEHGETRIQELADGIERRAEQTAAAESAFSEALAAAGFADEADYLAARLDRATRERLASEAQTLTEAATALTMRERETRAQLERERQRALTERPRAELEQAPETLGEEQKAAQREIGALRQRLADNAVVQLRHGERRTAIEAQRRECERWNALRELIGSSDGKKYRNFAQGLTLDSLIEHANRQLRQLSERYLLVRNPDQPLMLDVIDRDQAGEIRSTKNLSGGESFIVSLALALGLSRMASQRVRVDSLFLDEGFGTLDEEALETALETLAGLRRDGKLIGVISHVQALKDRIGAQIQVTPVRGGRSRIQGPGCAGGH